MEEHKQEDVNTQSDIAKMNEANQRGVRELDSKGLINTVEEIKNGGPGSLKSVGDSPPVPDMISR